MSIESWDSPQCSTNVIGAFQGYIGKGMKQKNEHKMKLKLTIFIGFGAKIWIQLLEKGDNTK